MADFVISTSSNAQQNLAGSDYGVILPGAYLMTDGFDAITGIGSPSLEVDGSVYAMSAISYALDFDGSALSMYVGADGLVSGPQGSAIRSEVTTITRLTNEGTIRARTIAIEHSSDSSFAGDAEIVNTGTITAGSHAMVFDARGGDINLSNNGLIAGTSMTGITISAAVSLRFENAGTLSGETYAISSAMTTGSSVILRNTGTINGRVDLGNSDTTVYNSGEIFGQSQLGMQFGWDEDELVNTGYITGAINMGAGINTLDNSGVIEGLIQLAMDTTGAPIQGIGQFQNTGTVIGNVTGGNQDDRIYSTGVINGTVVLNDGNDLYDGRGGVMTRYLRGGEGNDTIMAGALGEQHNGEGGDDLILGNVGNDSLYGNNGFDTVLGGAGDDIIDAGANNDSVGGGTGNDTIYGMGGNDTIYGFEGRDTIEGNDGSDLLHGGADADSVVGGGGNDTMYGGDGDDTMGGGDAADLVYGGNGDDSLLGWVANDTLYGNAGHDTLNGQAGADVLNGGWGDDLLTGGTEADVFVFIVQNGIDVVTDFENNTDLIDLTAFHTSFGAMSGAISDFNGGALIDFAMMGGSGSAWIQGTPAGFLNNNDFIF